jgi:hypothetical protein
MDPERCPVQMDHMPIIMVINVSMTPGEMRVWWNFKAADWKAFHGELEKEMALLLAPLELADEGAFHTAVGGVMGAILRTIEKMVPIYHGSPFVK